MNQVPRQNSKQANVIADGNLLEIGGGEMDEREAIEIFKRANSGTVMAKTKEAINLAIAALEKQIGRIPLDFECPRCHIDAAEEIFDKAFETYINKYDYFRQNCGQKLDWSEEE